MHINSLKKLSLVIFFISAAYMNAQNRLDYPELYIGLQGGMTGSMVNFSPLVDQTYLLGYNGGIGFRYIGHTFAGVLAELNYTQQGWAESNGLYTRQLNYLELPFLTHFYFGRKFKFHFNIGPRVSYLLSENVLVNNTLNSSAEQHIKNVFNKIDYGFCGGPGFSFQFKKQVIMLDIRANYSVSDIFSNLKPNYFSFSNNMNVKVNIAWQYKLR